MTSRPSSANTFVVGFWVNLAVSVDAPRVLIWLPIDPSVDPMASNSTTCGMRSSNCSLTSVVHMTPDDKITPMLERS